MDPTRQFFMKLKKLSLTLESETAKIQKAFDNRNNNDDDDDDNSEATARAMRAYHEINCEVANLKGRIRGQRDQLGAQVNEVSTFIKACRVMENRFTEDIRALRGHLENYGYRAPRDTSRPNRDKTQQSDAHVADEDQSASAEEDGSQEEVEGRRCSSSPEAGPPPFVDGLRTPQLSDFGLCEVQLKRTLAGAQWCSEVPPMPEMNLPQPSLNTPAPPPMPLTPKCALRMEDEGLHTPQMRDFGISEHTLCLNNDFTMDLFFKNTERPKIPSQNIPEPPINSQTESLQRKDLESPELPVFCTPGFKIKKTNGRCSSPERGNDEPANVASTPEVPAFHTLHVNRLVSTTKSARHRQPINVQTEDEDEPPTAPRNQAAGSKRSWDCGVPEPPVAAEDKDMPEMPKLESLLGRSLQSRNAKIPRKSTECEKPPVMNLDLDGATEEFSLGTPRVWMECREPSTPEMPDLSSVTQEICKLVSQAQSKKSMAVVTPQSSPEKSKTRAVRLSAVSDREFQSLPSYLRHVTLHRLNQAVDSINKFTAESEEEKTELGLEEVRKITNVGTMTPVYILCLTELKRLKHVGGVKNTSVYKLCSNN